MDKESLIASGMDFPDEGDDIGMDETSPEDAFDRAGADVSSSSQLLTAPRYDRSTLGSFSSRRASMPAAMPSMQNVMDDQNSSMRDKRTSLQPASREGSYTSVMLGSVKGSDSVAGSKSASLRENSSDSNLGGTEVDRKSVRPVLRPADRPLTLQQASDYFGGNGRSMCMYMCVCACVCMYV
jgi:hypothetical protein